MMWNRIFLNWQMYHFLISCLFISLRTFQCGFLQDLHGVQLTGVWPCDLPHQEHLNTQTQNSQSLMHYFCNISVCAECNVLCDCSVVCLSINVCISVCVCVCYVCSWVCFFLCVCVRGWIPELSPLAPVGPGLDRYLEMMFGHISAIRHWRFYF